MLDNFLTSLTLVSVPYEFLVHVTIILTFLEKLTRLFLLVNIRKSAFSDAPAMNPGRCANPSVLKAPRMGKKQMRK